MRKWLLHGKIKTGIKNVGTQIDKVVPQPVKDFSSKTKNIISEQEVMKKSMEILAKDFQKVQEFTAKYTVSPEIVYQAVNKFSKDNKNSIDKDDPSKNDDTRY